MGYIRDQVEKEGQMEKQVSPTENLMHEHEVIKRALKILQVSDERLAAGDDRVVPIYPKLVDFIRNFADECHHGKEEKLLFAKLEARGLPTQAGPVGVMLVEHDQGRGYVRGMAEAVRRYDEGDRAALEDLRRNAEGYANLLNQHIAKEDQILYPMANDILSDDDQEELEAGFDEVERNFGEDRHDGYVRMIEELERELKVA